MTPSDKLYPFMARAEKILSETGCKCEAPKYCGCVRLITAEIQAAVEEAEYTVANDLMTHYGKLIEQRIAEAFAEGKRDAYGDAAKTVEFEHKHCSPPLCEIANKIRARAKALSNSDNGELNT